MEKTDLQLVAEFLTGKQDAFSEMYNRYVNAAYGLCRNSGIAYDHADDAVQEIFLKVFRGLGGFKQQSAFSTWFYRVAVNTARDFQRKQSLLNKVLFFWNMDDDGNTDPVQAIADTRWWSNPADVAGGGAVMAKLMTAVMSLPVRQQEVFRLRTFQGLKIREIAAILGLDEGTVKSHLSRALRTLKPQMEEHF